LISYLKTVLIVLR